MTFFRQKRETEQIAEKCFVYKSETHAAILSISGTLNCFCQGGTTPETNEIVTHICSCYNFVSLSSVQILFIPACCLLCVL